MNTPSVRSILPKSLPGLMVLIFGVLVIFALPTSSKFVSYRYLFSWSMYNGAWVHEKYTLSYIDPTLSTTLSRSEAIDKYKVNLLPYGVKPLEIFCKDDNSLKSVERDGKFSVKYYCNPNSRDSK